VNLTPIFSKYFFNILIFLLHLFYFTKLILSFNLEKEKGKVFKRNQKIRLQPRKGKKKKESQSRSPMEISSRKRKKQEES